MSEARLRCARRALGAFGEEVSALGLGLGPLAKRGDASDWDATVGAALDAGITSIDAAAGPLRHESESKLGEILTGRRDGLFLSTRSGAREPTGETNHSSSGTKRAQTRASAVRASLEDSLKRLRTDRIDLYHVHDPSDADPGLLFEETLPALVEARERGDIRYVGVSTHDLTLLVEALHAFPLDAILCYGKLDLLDHSLARDVLPEAQSLGVAVVNASPFHGGRLSTNTSQSLIPAEHGALAPLLTSAIEQGADLTQAALQFAASFEGVSTTVVGMATPREIERVVRDFARAPSGSERTLVEGVLASAPRAQGE